MKTIGINPTNTYTSAPGVIQGLRTLVQDCELVTTGYTVLNLHTNFVNSVVAAVGSSDVQGVLNSSDILWPMNIVSLPYQYNYYDNTQGLGAIPYNTPALEEIYVCFTDEWNGPVLDIAYFVLLLNDMGVVV